MKEKKVRRPNLFLVGCPRSGTTSLYSFLNYHANIYMSPIKGPNFFSEYKNNSFPKYHKNEKKYLSLYKNRKEKWLGDASHYFSSEIAPKEIKKFNEKAKILIILRKPLDMAISHYTKKMLRENERLEDLFSKKKKSKQLKFLKKRLEYEKNVKRYLDVFGRKNVKILIFEDLKKNPKKIKKELGKFLEVEEELFGKIPESNVSRKDKLPFLKKIISLFPINFRIFVKKALPKKILMDLQLIIEKKTFGERIRYNKKNIPKKLIEKNNLETKKLNKILEKDISEWIEK